MNIPRLTFAIPLAIMELCLGGALQAQASSDPSPLASAHWIADAAAVGLQPTDPFPLLRRTFTAGSSPIVRATLFATALGSYQASINGERVSDAILSPGWEDYRLRVLYQTYDVTKLVHPGANAIGVMLGAGWFGSPIGGAAYGDQAPPVRFLGLLQITHADGTTETIASDSTWRSTQGPITMAEIYYGEAYDARRLPSGWNQASFDDHGWDAVAVLRSPKHLAVTPQVGPLIEPELTVTPVRNKPVGQDTVMYDLGQNMVGWMRVWVHGSAGDTVQIAHTEVLKPDSLHVDRGTLRSAEATDHYTLAGGAEETLEPHFTYHGFRYIQVVTSPGVKVDSLVGVVFHTAMKETITFESSNPAISKLFQNVMWGLRGNTMSIPTDCPQRSERLGWTGDAAAIWPTMVFFMNAETFTRKWAQDLRDEQSRNPEGCYPSTVPGGGCGGPAWSDAGILVPWASYLQYGDTTLLRQHWASMERYMKFIADSNPDFLWKHESGGYGDWGAPGPNGEGTNGDLIATAMWASDARAMRDMARGLGNQEAAAHYDELYQHIKAAFNAAYVSSGGVVGAKDDQTGAWTTSQTSDVLALYNGLLSDSLQHVAAKQLVDDIAARGHLATGFVGTKRILPALSDQGRDDIAYQLLLTDDYPSWLNMVKLGATTPWEYWNALEPEPPHKISGASLNHYAFGAVAEWIIRYAVGIAQDSGTAGFQHLVIHPHPDPLGRVTHMTIHYDSPIGAIVSGWTTDPKTGAVTLNVTIPAHASARVDVPERSGTGYRYVSHTVGAGTHRFVGAVERASR